ncbi:MAG: NAD(+) synthase [Kiritimatiellia bacterium]
MDKKFGFCRVASAIPVVKPGAVKANVDSMLKSVKMAAEAGVDILVLPELCITGYTCADLFYQETLLNGALQGLKTFLEDTKSCSALIIAGMPLKAGGLLLNCAVLCRKGKVCGVVPKKHLPNTGEFYEQRWFSSAVDFQAESISLFGADVPAGSDLVFHFDGLLDFGIGVEICEDLWSVIPPSSCLSLQGAMLLCNLSASNELVGKFSYRHELVRQQSARCICAYAYCGAGVGESSTDLVFGGDAIIVENGRQLGKGARFFRSETMLVKDVDFEFLAFERRRNKVFQQSISSVGKARKINVGAASVNTPVNRDLTELQRPLDAHPFVPGDESVRAERCEEIFAIQSSGLATRLEHTGCRDVVVGLSGGLDSSLALLVAVEAFERLELDKKGIHAITLPGFGTSERTLRNTRDLAAGLGLELEEVDINKACKQHLADLGHSGVEHDVAFENTQARERTQILMNRANMLKAMVVGTGDLSELAMGWCTYNGDHMSMYGVNSGVPKTLVRYLIQWFTEYRSGAETARALLDILDTPVSPELLPVDTSGKIAQKTEDVIGPYELHDFFLHSFVRCGYSRAKTRFLARIAFKNTYTASTIDRWLELFIKRLFSQQFKRSCMPDGPKVGSINLSPRGDWRMPSDASASEWRLR